MAVQEKSRIIQFVDWMFFDVKFFFLVLLPPVVFEAGYVASRDVFLELGCHRDHFVVFGILHEYLHRGRFDVFERKLLVTIYKWINFVFVIREFNYDYRSSDRSIRLSRHWERRRGFKRLDDFRRIGVEQRPSASFCMKCFPSKSR